MKFSILVAHYNNFNYFQECYKSIENQSFQNFEVIIVDDGSDSENYNQLTALLRDNPKYKIFRNQENRGVGFTKRRCVELASGEICGFVDPDDAIYENALEESLRQYTSAEIVATYSQIMICDSTLTPTNIYPRTRRIKNNNKLFFNINNEVSHFFTFRKETYEKTQGINEALTSAEDFDIYLKLYEKGKFQFIEKPLYYYRVHQGGISQDIAKKEKAHKNWNKILYDACQRRSISKIGPYQITEDINIIKIIFDRENSLTSKVKRYILKLLQR